MIATARTARIILIGVLGLLLAAASVEGPDRSPDGVLASKHVAPTFQIKGSVAGLFPGTSRGVHVTLTNRTSFAMRVTSLAITEVRGDPSHPLCPTKYIGTEPWTGEIPLPANGTVSRTDIMRVRLSPSATNACQGVRFGLVFSGRGVQA